MKTISIFVFFSFLLLPFASAQKTLSDSLRFTILLKNGKAPVDSVLIIFDRYDLTGAGVIKKIFYPLNNQIIIEKVPKGKYYVDVISMGVDHQYLSRISTVGGRRSNKMQIRFKTFETYIPGTAIIPTAEIDFNNLVVTQNKFNK